MSAGGLVVAANQAAAEVGASLLAAGGSAIDAAVGTALALTVLEPSQCGLGGYGGFVTCRTADGEPFRVSFNTHVPARLGETVLGGVLGGNVTLPDGGAAVAPPAVVPGLLCAHAHAGRLGFSELVAPAVGLAREGFAVGPDLVRALTDHWARTGGGSPGFARIFFPDGRPPEVGDRLCQPDLARTLEQLDETSFRSGSAVVDAICETVAADDGFLEPADFDVELPVAEPPDEQELGAARVYGPPRAESGAGIVFPALASLDPDSLGDNRSAAYVGELARVLREAWAERARGALGDLRATHTTHLCAADAEGSLVSLTFTHGRRKFGSGLVAHGTGVVLNSGVALFARTPDGPRAVANMAPVIVEDGAGARHALGGVGGPRIPAMVLTAIVDLVHYGMPLRDAIAAPHLAVRPTDGELEAEPALFEHVEAAHSWSSLAAGETFGPATGITRTADGSLVAAPDPRFPVGVAGPA